MTFQFYLIFHNTPLFNTNWEIYAANLLETKMQRIKYLFLAELFPAYENKAHIKYNIESIDVKDL